MRGWARTEAMMRWAAALAGSVKRAKPRAVLRKGNGPGGNRAAIDAAGQFIGIAIADLADGGGDGPLHGMFALHIAMGINAKLARKRQHAGMFAGAVVVNGAGFSA